MPPQRTPLRAIDGNGTRGKDITPYMRGKIVGAANNGASPAEIQARYGVSRGAVRGSIAQDFARPEGESRPRSGCPPTYTDRDERMMLRNLRLFAKSTFNNRRQETGLQMSNSTIKRLAQKNGLHHWRAKKRPELTEEHAAERLLWCKCRAHWGVEEWKKYMWSDECSAERGRGKLIEWVFGLRDDKWKPSHVTTYKKGKDLRVMVWAAFWGSGNRTPLYIMDRDFESKKNGFSANSYIEVLDAHAQYMNDDLVFMQDNASIHTAHKVKDWFREQRVRTTDWPPYSPDLNPIENAWHAMKCLALKMFPEIMNGGGKSEEDIKQVEECLKAAWIALPSGLFEGYIESMERRVKMCIQAEGWHTKY
jgi:DDE superfamily endonuclease/Transposase